MFPLGLLLKWGTNLGHIKGLFRETRGTFFWAVVCFNGAQGVASFRPKKRWCLFECGLLQRLLKHRSYVYVPEHLYFLYPWHYCNVAAEIISYLNSKKSNNATFG